MAAKQNRDQAIAEQLPMVRLLARRMHRRLPVHVGMEELISAGALGLVEAASRFDWGAQVPFAIYARTRVKGAMLDFLRGLDWGSRSLRRQAREMEHAIQALVAKGISAPSEAAIASEMGLPLSQYQQFLSDLVSTRLGSLQMESKEDAGEQEIDRIQGSVTEDPLYRYLQGEVRDRLIAAIDTLPEKERLVLCLHYYEQLTMREVSQVLGFSPSRISQIHSSAIAELRASFSATRDDALLWP